MSATLHAFPAAHSFNSPRSWVLALIVIIHLGFFWLLTSGMGQTFLMIAPPQTQAVIIEEPVKKPPEPQKPADPLVQSSAFVPKPFEPRHIDVTVDDTAVRDVTSEVRPPQTGQVQREPESRQPVEVLPEIDPRRGLSEPIYPATLIRQGVEGTVVLAVQVLENGRVGDVRIERSSGELRLDESAAREARRWRFVPGTRDGVPVVLWKQVPVTFRIQDRH